MIARRLRNHDGQVGFTLVETLISSAILGVIAVALFGTITFYFKGLTTARQQLDRSRVIKAAIDHYHATGRDIPEADTPGYTVKIVYDGVSTTQAGLTYGLKAYRLTATRKDNGSVFQYVFYWR